MLKVEEHDVPVPKEGEVLIKVKACSVSWWDVAFRTKLIKPIPGRADIELPQQLGREGSGEVVGIGQNVDKFSVGDRVITMTNPACGACPFCQRGFDNLCIRTSLPAHTSFGNYAQYVTRKQEEVLAAPDNLGFETLGCILWSYGTVQYMIDGRANLQPGETVLITGASGGMGTAAIQLCKVAGAGKIIALSSATAKYRTLLESGADVVLNYKDEDIIKRVRGQTTMKMGVDVVLDCVGGPMASLGMNCIKMSGRLVLAASMGGEKMELSIIDAFVKNVSILGSRACRKKDQEYVLQLAAEGKIKPLISHTLPLSEVVKANHMLEAGDHTGKIVLIP